jgi:drug/metabolite transporter (DMT)-like permease
LAWRPGCRADAAWGALLVFLSAVSYAIYLVYSGEMVQALGSLRLVGLATTVACLLCLLQFVLLRPAERGGGGARGDLAVGAQCHAVHRAPVLMVMMAIERIGAGMAAQTGMVGPMSTILMGVVILGEPLNSWIIAGTVLVITGIYVFSRSARQA